MSKNLKTLFFVILLSGIMLSYRIYYLSNLNIFTTGTVIKSSVLTKSSKFSCRYRFSVLGKTYEGLYKSVGRPSRFNKDVMFLIGYDASNPDFNFIFFDKPINSPLLVDSLNNCCKPIEFISYKDYLKGS